MSMQTKAVSVLGLIAAVMAGPAVAVEASGQAVAVLSDTQANGPGGNRALETKGPVYSGDVIKTNRSGTAQIQFADKTKMVIGPNAQVTIDRFVYQGSATASVVAIDALRGSFRFITGVSAKTAYSINTPTATIGVRGTAFDGHVAGDGTTTIAMWHGAVRLCDKTRPRTCYDVSGTCSVVQLGPEGPLNRVNSVYERTALLDRWIPFAFRQLRLQTGFRVSSSGCEIRDLDPTIDTRDHPDAPPPPPPPPQPVVIDD